LAGLRRLSFSDLALDRVTKAAYPGFEGEVAEWSKALAC
jgi:hypothetical protein